MKKNRLQLVNWLLSLIALIALVAVINLVIALRPQGEPQGSDIQPLEERLRELGVPIKSIVVTSQSPLEIEVVLQTLESDARSGDDIWYEFLTVRELELAYLNFEIPVERYRLIVVTPEGDKIGDSTTFLYPDLPSQKITPAPSSVANSETADIVRENLDLQGLELLSLDVPSSYTDRYNSKLISLDLSTGTSAAEKTDMDPINRLVYSMRPQIEAINDRYGTRIVLVRARIRDAENNLLVDYIEDIEIGRLSSWTAENIEAGWFPIPAETDSPAGLEVTDVPSIITPATPTATPTATPPRPTEPYPSP